MYFCVDKCTRAPEPLPTPTPILFFFFSLLGTEGNFRGYSSERKVGIQAHSPGEQSNQERSPRVWVAQCNFSLPNPELVADGNAAVELGRSRGDKEEKKKVKGPIPRQGG